MLGFKDTVTGHSTEAVLTFTDYQHDVSSYEKMLSENMRKK